MPSSSEKRRYNDIIKKAEEEMIRAGDYDIGKPQIMQLAFCVLIYSYVYIILTVLCTCNEACSVRIVDNIEPTHLIIDEAAMATEPEAMIPIQLADHVTLIGDHMQLQVCVLPNIVSLLMLAIYV